MTSGEQVKTWPCSAEHVMRHPNFALGLADIRAGRPFADQIEYNLWAYERGRQFGAIAPRSLPLFIKGKLNPRALQLLEAAYERRIVM